MRKRTMHRGCRRRLSVRLALLASVSVLMVSSLMGMPHPSCVQDNLRALPLVDHKCVDVLRGEPIEVSECYRFGGFCVGVCLRGRLLEDTKTCKPERNSTCQYDIKYVKVKITAVGTCNMPPRTPEGGHDNPVAIIACVCEWIELPEDLQYEGEVKAIVCR